MHDGKTAVLGLIIHSDDPFFLGIVGLHVVVGLVAVAAGLVAMLAPKRRGGHSLAGAMYFWAIVAIFSSAAILTFLRGPEDFPVFALGAGALVSAWVGRSARRGRWRNSTRVHIAGMGGSYVFMLTAFYVETGDQLPLWRDLPPIAYWVVPALVGFPLIARALIRHAPTR